MVEGLGEAREGLRGGRRRDSFWRGMDVGCEEASSSTDYGGVNEIPREVAAMIRSPSAKPNRVKNEQRSSWLTSGKHCLQIFFDLAVAGFQRHSVYGAVLL